MHDRYEIGTWEYILISKMLEVEIMAIGLLHQNSFLYHNTYLIVSEPVALLLIDWSTLQPWHGFSRF